MILDTVIDRDGNVLSVQLRSGDPLLAEAAIEVAQAWVYRPAKLNGIPVEVATEIEIKFTLPKQT